MAFATLFKIFSAHDCTKCNIESGYFRNILGSNQNFVQIFHLLIRIHDYLPDKKSQTVTFRITLEQSVFILKVPHSYNHMFENPLQKSNEVTFLFQRKAFVRLLMKRCALRVVLLRWKIPVHSLVYGTNTKLPNFMSSLRSRCVIIIYKLGSSRNDSLIEQSQL